MISMPNPGGSTRLAVLLLPLLLCGGGARAQSPAAAEVKPVATATAVTAEPVSLTSLAWLAGCWQGSVNLREFREQWSPLRGGLMVGVSHTVIADKTQDFEFLRLETRPDGIYYVAVSGGKDESVFKLKGRTTDGEDQIYTFANRVDEFPQTLIYRLGAKGWLYAHVEGTVSGAEQKVIYPMARINCETGAVIEK
jgi:hypothetical protein